MKSSSKPRSNFPRRKLCLLFAAAALSYGAAPLVHEAQASDPQVTAVQEALKREQFLFQEPTGVMDDATRSALRRYQIRNGLPASGEIDSATSQALQNKGDDKSNAPLTSAAVPSAIPGIPKTVRDEDRRILNELEAKDGAVAADKPAKPVPPADSIHPPQLAPPPVQPETAATKTVKEAPPSVETAPPALEDKRRAVVAETTMRPQFDRRQVERESVAPPPIETETAPPPPIAEGPKTRVRDREAIVDAGPKKHRTAVPRVSDSPSADTVQDEDAPQREADLSTPPPPPRTERHADRETVVSQSAPPSAAPETETAPPPPGSRIITTTTRTTGPDGRTYTTQKRTVIPPGARDESEWRTPHDERTEPARPQREGFFHRLFRPE